MISHHTQKKHKQPKEDTISLQQLEAKEVPKLPVYPPKPSKSPKTIFESTRRHLKKPKLSALKRSTASRSSQSISDERLNQALSIKSLAYHSPKVQRTEYTESSVKRLRQFSHSAKSLGGNAQCSKILNDLLRQTSIMSTRSNSMLREVINQSQEISSKEFYFVGGETETTPNSKPHKGPTILYENKFMKKQCARIIAQSQESEAAHQSRMNTLKNEVDRLSAEAESLRELIKQSSRARGYRKDISDLPPSQIPQVNPQSPSANFSIQFEYYSGNVILEESRRSQKPQTLTFKKKELRCVGTAIKLKSLVQQ